MNNFFFFFPSFFFTFFSDYVLDSLECQDCDFNPMIPFFGLKRVKVLLKERPDNGFKFNVFDADVVHPNGEFRVLKRSQQLKGTEPIERRDKTINKLLKFFLLF
eukprot:PhM_4_TR13968/c1_g1_i2/m.91845